MSTDSSILSPGQQIKVILDTEDAKELVELRYNFRVKSIVELDAYDDRNYRVLCEDRIDGTNPHVPSVAKDGYVLKIMNSLDSQKTGFVEAQNELLLFLNKKGFPCPVPVKQNDGSYYSIETIGKDEKKRHILRLLVYCPGEVLAKVPISIKLLKNVGSFAARLDKILEEFTHPAYDNRTSLWFLSEVPKIRDFMFVLNDKNDVDLIEEIISSFESNVLTIMNSLGKGIIHGDLNESNLIVTPDGEKIEAIIDFGDSHINCFVFELAICLCYMIAETSIEMGRYVIEGYRSTRQLTNQEKAILKICICARMAQSLVMGAYSYQREPNNQYLIRAHATRWTLLKKLWPMNDTELLSLWGL